MARIGTFDVETNGLFPEVDKVWCAVVHDHATGERTRFTPASIEDLCPFLETFDILCGHNCIAYDFPVLRKVFGWEYKGRKVDTLLMSRAQRPLRQSHSVEAWGIRLGGEKKVENEDWTKFSLHMLKRCDTDVTIQVKILNELVREGQGEGWKHSHRLNAAMFHYLNIQEENGWHVDQEKMDWCLYMLDRWMARIDRAIEPHLPIKVRPGKLFAKPFKKDGDYCVNLYKYFGEDADTLKQHVVSGPFTRVELSRISPDKNKELKQALLDMGWLPAEWNYNADGERTSPKLDRQDPFEGVSGSLGKLLVQRTKCKHRKGAVAGWAELIRGDGRISTPVAGIAATGRLRHKGVVNVPSPHSDAFFAKHMRSIFVATPGWYMAGIDSKGNQIRQLAARMGDPEFTAAVLHGNAEDGTDLHSLNQRKSGAPSRSRAKNFFYGFIFGAGDAKIGEVVDGNSADGKRLKEEYLEGLPLLRDLIETETTRWRETAQNYYDKKQGRMIFRNGYIRGLDGRPIMVDSEHKILCYLLQSDEAIQMGVAYVMVHKWAEAAGLKLGEDWRMLIWMHDEFQIEGRTQEITEQVAELAKKAIGWAGKYLNIGIEHDGDILYGKNWYETH